MERGCVAHIACAQPRRGHHRSGQTAHDQDRSNHRAGRMAQCCELCRVTCLVCATTERLAPGQAGRLMLSPSLSLPSPRPGPVGPELSGPPETRRLRGEASIFFAHAVFNTLPSTLQPQPNARERHATCRQDAKNDRRQAALMPLLHAALSQHLFRRLQRPQQLQVMLAQRACTRPHRCCPQP